MNCVETLTVPKMSRDDKTVTCFSQGGCEEWRRIGDVVTVSQLSKTTENSVLLFRQFLRGTSGPDALSACSALKHFCKRPHQEVGLRDIHALTTLRNNDATEENS